MPTWRFLLEATSLTLTQAFSRASTISVHWYKYTGGGCSFGSHLGKQHQMFLRTFGTTLVGLTYSLGQKILF